LQARWRDGDLAFAVELMDAVLAHFQDPAGGFFFTSDDHETLIQRPKPDHDDATPSGNGIAAKVLGRLGHILGESRYLDAADNTLKSLWASIEESTPHAHASLLLALEESLLGFQTVIIRGKGDTLEDWRLRAASTYAPSRFTLAIPATASDLPARLAERKPVDDMVAYICSGLVCGEPVTDFETFHSLLTEAETGRQP